jgi:hypothetical protein
MQMRRVIIPQISSGRKRVSIAELLPALLESLSDTWTNFRSASLPFLSGMRTDSGARSKPSITNAVVDVDQAGYKDKNAVRREDYSLY